MAAASEHSSTPAFRSVLLLVASALCAPGAALALSPPSNISGTSDCQKITLSADAVPGATGYVVRIYVEDYLPALPDTIVAALPFLDYAPPNQRRSYQLATVDGSSSVGPLSAIHGQYNVLGPIPQAGVLLGPHAALTGTSFTLNATTSQITQGTVFTWRKNGVVFSNGNQPVFHKVATLADSGTYTMEASNTCGSTTTPAFDLHVTNAVNAPSNITATALCDSISVTWNHRAGAWAYVITRDPPFTSGDGPPLPGPKVATNSFIDHVTRPLSYRYFVASVVYDSLFGDFSNSNQVTSKLRATIVPPEPADKTIEVGTSVSWTAYSLGTGTLTYTWRKDGAAIETGSSTLTIANAQTTDSGTYDFIACSNCGCDTTRAILLKVCSTPGIDVPTAARLVGANEGTNVTLTATVSGAPALQWFHDSVALADGPRHSGTTTGSLTIVNAQLTDAGYYHLLATGNCQVVQGSVIAVEVDPCYQPPVITQQPAAKHVVETGVSVTMTVAATCCAPMSYQWLFRPPGGSAFSNVPGATAPTLTINPVTAGSFGTYFCRVGNRGHYTNTAYSVLASTATPVFTYWYVFPGCDYSTVSWKSDIPVVASLRTWSGSCDNGPGAVLSLTQPATEGLIHVPNVPGQNAFARLEGVSAGDETGYSDCMYVAQRLQSTIITASWGSQQYYYTSLPGGGFAAPVVLFLRNDGCLASSGQYLLTAPTMDGAQQDWLTANGDPAFPASPLPVQIPATVGSGAAGRWVGPYYLRVTRPPEGVTEKHILAAKVLYTPDGGSPIWLDAVGRLYLTRERPY